MGHWYSQPTAQKLLKKTSILKHSAKLREKQKINKYTYTLKYQFADIKLPQTGLKYDFHKRA